jgi:signal transduction histidine kinase/DNA-binding response OmpR family regulator
MPTVLVIDDHAPTRDYLATVLRYAGLEVEEAADGLEGYQRALALEPALIVCDLLMPRMDGFELAKRVRATASLAGTPIVFCTATYLEKEARRLAEALGVTNVLIKPVSADNLLQTVSGSVGPVKLPAADVSASMDLDRAHVTLLADKLLATTDAREMTSQRLALVVEASSEMMRTSSVAELAELLCRAARKIVGARHAFLVPLGGRLRQLGPVAVHGFGEGEAPVVELEPALVERLATRHAVRAGGGGAPVGELVSSTARFGDLLAVKLGPAERPEAVVCCMDRLGEGFTGDDESFLRMLADLAHAGMQRALLAQQLQQSQKMDAVGRLAGGVAHDFNNLLTVIQGQASILLDRGDASAAEPLTEIKSASERASALTRQLLTFSRSQVLQPRVVRLNEVVRETERMLRRIIGEHIELELELAADAGNVRVDANQLGQVLLNFAVNARDAMPGGGRVTITTAPVTLEDGARVRAARIEPGRYAVLRFADTGHGMDEDTRARVFEPFFTTKAPGSGTGLGLSTVYGIVSQSGGAVHVESQPGQGAVFEVLLPAVDGPLVADAPAAPAPASAVTGATVLVVEDDPSVRRLMKSVLGKAGYTVLDAADADAALALSAAHSGRIDVLVADLVLPGMTGVTLCEKLRAGRPELRVLFCSGYAERVPGNAIALPANALFLPKPFQSGTLLHKVREALAY